MHFQPHLCSDLFFFLKIGKDLVHQGGLPCTWTAANIEESVFLVLDILLNKAKNLLFLFETTKDVMIFCLENLDKEPIIMD